MAEPRQVTLYGTWPSTYCAMVHNALRLKGVPYDYVEEDLDNKSEALLRLNPVHKKVPVLEVDGKAVAESSVILEFVEDLWKKPPVLLPEDPYLKAKVRFWAAFIYQKLIDPSYTILRSTGGAQEAAKEIVEHLITLEHGLQKDLPRTTTGTFIHGETPGILDIILSSNASGIRVLGELLGTELLQKERTPLLSSAVAAFAEMEVLKDTMAPYDKLREYVQSLREKALAMAT